LEPSRGTGTGCGLGVRSVGVARAGYRVFAIDISQTMLRETRDRIGAAGFASAVEFRQEDLTRLTLPDASCRYVVSCGVIIHKLGITAAELLQNHRSHTDYQLPPQRE